jgi:Protein of unknown function (DUF1501)
MKCEYSCKTAEHVIARRAFLGGVAGALGASTVNFGALLRPAQARQLAATQKQILCVNMAGGLSQLESWDPKPKTDTGGPFCAIPTSVPGIHLCELLPRTAQQMHRLAIVRSVNTHENDHGKGHYMMLKGRREQPGLDYPTLGAVAAKALSPINDPLPGHIQITPGGGGSTSNDAAYLGPKYSSVVLGNGQPPQNTARPASVSEEADQRRNLLRARVNDHFAMRRRTATTDAYTYSYEQAAQLMQRRELFDVTKEPAKDQQRYGGHDFGRHCLLARRLLGAGVTYVQVTHSNYDTHNENFNFHLEQLGEFDQSFATLVDDLAQRGMLEHTLIVVLSEFGRTPRINQNYGRDHWGTAWSVVLAGAGVQKGAVIGKTNENGTAVVDHQVDHANLFHTYLKAVGLDPTANFDVGGRPMPMADPASKAIKELLA